MLFEKLKTFWELAQNALAGARAQPLFALLGLVSGIISGIIVVLFRLIIETSQSRFLPGGDPENYEALGIDERMLLTASGGVILGLLFFLVSRAPIRVGVIHVMERLAYYEGHLPLKNAVMQFIGGSIALMTIEEASAEAVYVLGFMGLSPDPIYGVATKQDIIEAYRMKGPSSYY